MKYLSLFLLIMPLAAITIIDDFDDWMVDSTFWSIQRSDNTELEEFDGVCRMRMNYGGCGGPHVCFNTKRMKKCIIGDFDAYAVFDVVERGEGDITPFMLIATNDCTRNRVSIGWATHYGFSNWRAETIDSTDSVWTILSSTATSETSGKIRLSRVGDWFYMYYWNSIIDRFFPLDSIEYRMDKTYLALHVQNQGTHEALDIAIDSFYLECDSLWYSECEPPETEPMCMNESMQLEISDLEGVDERTIALSLDGIPYSVPDPSIEWDEPDLTLNPPAPYAHGSVHELCLFHVEDIIGNAFLDTLCWTFTTDLRPPTISDPIPAPGDTIYEFTPMISCRILDDYHDVDESNLRILVNGIARPSATYDGEYLSLDMTTSFPLRYGDSVVVCAQATDLIPRCAPNDTVFCWYFITGDSIRPEAGPHYPSAESLITACDDQSVSIIVTDNIAVDEETIVIEAGGNTFHWPDNMAMFGDTLVFTPDFTWIHGLNTICITELEDVWNNEPPEMPVCFDIMTDLAGPVFSGLEPTPDAVVSATAPDIVFLPTDETTTVFPDSFIVTIDDTMVFYLTPATDSIYDVIGDTVRFYSQMGNVHLSGGHEARVCVSAFDTPDICSPNLGDTCWIFSIAEGGPLATPVLPQPDMITACDYSEITIVVEDADSVNWSTLELFVLDQTYTYDSPEILISGDTIVFMPTSPFSHGDVVEVDIMRLDDMLDNPLSIPLEYTFTVDLIAPEAIMANPTPGSIIRNSRPQITIGLQDQFAGLGTDSITFTVNDTLSFQYPDPAIEWNESGDQQGEVSLFLERTNIRLVSGDSVAISIRVCDDPDLCPGNCASYNWFFRMEGHRNCVAIPNPFSPNGDDFNPVVNFQYPGQDLDPAEVIIFTQRGEEVFRKMIEPSYDGTFIPERTWDGRSTDGIELPQGMYMYIVTVYGEMVCNGTITILR